MASKHVAERLVVACKYNPMPGMATKPAAVPRLPNGRIDRALRFLPDS